MLTSSKDNDDGEVEFRGTQPIAGPRRSHDFLEPKISSSRSPYSISLPDIEQHKAVGEAISQTSLGEKAPFIYSLSQNVEVTQLPPNSSATTFNSRGWHWKRRGRNLVWSLGD